MCTITELDKKNDKQHRELRNDFLTKLNNLEDNLVTKLLDNGTKTEIAIERMEAATDNMKASTKVTNFYKFLVTLLLAVIGAIGLFNLHYVSVSAEARIDTNNKMSEVKAMLQKYNVDAVYSFQDSLTNVEKTLDKHIVKTNGFVNGKFTTLDVWTHKVMDDKIVPTEIRSKKNSEDIVEIKKILNIN